MMLAEKFNFRQYIGNYILVTVIDTENLEIDEILSSEPTMDDVLRKMNFMSNKRDPDSITAMSWNNKSKRYIFMSHPYPGTYKPKGKYKWFE